MNQSNIPLGKLVRVLQFPHTYKVVGYGIGIDPHTEEEFNSVILYREALTGNSVTDFFCYVSVNPALCEEL